jgi:hypothetical protein
VCPCCDALTKRKLQQAPVPLERLLTQQFRGLPHNQDVMNDVTFSIALYLIPGTKSRWVVREGARLVASFQSNGN